VAAEPTFEAVLAYAKVVSAEGIKVPLTPDFRHDLPKMAAACDASTGLVYVCNPNNPTATIVTGDEMAASPRRSPLGHDSRGRGVSPLRPRTRATARASISSAGTRTSSSRARSPRFTGWRA